AFRWSRMTYPTACFSEIVPLGDVTVPDAGPATAAPAVSSMKSTAYPPAFILSSCRCSVLNSMGSAFRRIEPAEAGCHTVLLSDSASRSDTPASIAQEPLLSEHRRTPVMCRLLVCERELQQSRLAPGAAEELQAGW